MGLLRSAAAVAVVSVTLLGACSSGTSLDPPQSNVGLDCLVYPLASAYCCNTSDPPDPPCIGDFAAAQECGSWPTGSQVLAYPYACEGLVAVAVVEKGTGYTRIYAYDSDTLQLTAVGDDAASNTQNNTALECGAGPKGFTFPGACSQQWLDATMGTACNGGTAAPKSLCD